MSEKVLKARLLTADKILYRLPKDCFSFAKDDKEGKPEDALGLDLSDLDATGLSPDALKPFTKLRRLTLKGNHIAQLGPDALPKTLSYLDVSKNSELKDLSFVKGLRSLTTLILSECPAVGEVLNLEGELFAECVSLKVLVLDRCDLKGTLSLSASPFADKLETLIVSHNQLKKIDLKNCTGLTKLSASHNPGLRKVKNVPSRTIAEIRLANCPELESLGFLSKLQSKLALLDLSSSPLVKSWSDLRDVLSVDSLLTLNLKGTPLYDSLASSKDDYERECLKALKCRKLRTLDYHKVTVKLAAEDMADKEDDEGEDFDKLLAASKDDSDDEEGGGKKGMVKSTVKKTKKRVKSESLAAVVDEGNAVSEAKHLKPALESADGGLFEGISSKW